MKILAMKQWFKIFLKSRVKVWNHSRSNLWEIILESVGQHKTLEAKGFSEQSANI